MAAPGSAKVFAPWNNPDEVPLIRIEGVTKRFGDFVAIDNISLDIYRREFFALLGPSGCGKTTLMRMLAGFEAPTSGRITIDAAVNQTKLAAHAFFPAFTEHKTSLGVSNGNRYGLCSNSAQPGAFRT